MRASSSAGRRARSRRLGLLHHLRRRRGRALHVRHRRDRESRAPGVDAKPLYGAAADHGRRDLRPVADRQDGGEADARRVRAGLRVRPRAPARRARCRCTHRSTSPTSIDEGPRIYIERINIIGNMRTRDYVIRREFRLAEGDAYNPLMVDKAKKRLQSAGLLQDRRDQAPAGLGTRPGRSRRRAGGAVDRRAVVRRRLLDQSKA